jgi:hypothetical protein
MANHKTSKGIPFDMDAIRMQNEHIIAAGNAPLNARGDVIGSGGRVIKKAEELTREQYANQQSQVSSSAKLKQPIEDVVAELDPPAKAETKKKKTVDETLTQEPPTLTKEVILDNGDIVLVDEEQDPDGGLV